MWREKAVLKDTDDLVVSVAFDPKGKTFAAGGAVKNVSVWNATDFKNVQFYNSETMTIRNISKAVAYSPDGLHFAESYRGGAIVKFAENWKNVFMEKLPRGYAVEIVKGQEIPLALVFGPTEEIQGKKLNRLAMTDGHSVIATIWIDGAQPGSAQFGPLDGAPKIEGVPPAGVAYSPDGKQLVFIPNYKMAPGEPIGKPDPKKDTLWIAQVWGGGSGAAMAFLKHGTAQVTAVAWSRDGKFIATGDAEGDIALWDGKTFKEMKRMKIGGRGGKSYIHSLAFTNDSKTLAVATTYDEGTNANRVVFFDPATGNRGDDLQHFSSLPLSLAFSPDDKTLIVGCGYREAEARKMTAEERKKAGEVRVFTTDPK
jgi:WD40 repeat protein